jgi:hypothetical protein
LVGHGQAAPRQAVLAQRAAYVVAVRVPLSH